MGSILAREGTNSVARSGFFDNYDTCETNHEPMTSVSDQLSIGMDLNLVDIAKDT